MTNDLEKLELWLVKIGRVDQIAAASLLTRFSRDLVKCGSYLVRVGDQNPKVSFVARGLLKASINDKEGKAVNQAFYGEKEVAAPYSDIILKQPSSVDLIALEDSTVYSLPSTEFRALFESHHCWHNVGRLLAEKFLIANAVREKSLLIDDARARIDHFRKYYGHFETRLKRADIAAFVGIDPATLSRIDKL